MSVNILGAAPPSNGVGTQAIPQDFRAPIRYKVKPEDGVDQIILLPHSFQWCTVSVAPSAGSTATLYRTVSSPERIRQGKAIWHKWDHGEINAPAYYDWENPWVAFKIECSGPTLVEIVAKYA